MPHEKSHPNPETQPPAAETEDAHEFETAQERAAKLLAGAPYDRQATTKTA